MSREAMQLALEALDSDNPDIQLRAAIALRQALETEQEPVAWISDSPTKGNGKQLHWTKSEAWRWSSNITPLYAAPPRKREWVGLTDEEIDALSQARSLTDELMDCVDRLGSEADTVDPRVWQHLLVYAPKPEEEPVAWMHNFITGNVITHIPADIGRHPERWTALYKDPTPCKTCESLAMAVMNDQTYHEKVIPKREWVGLTDQEIHEIDGYEEDRKMYRFARTIEAKLKEKNHG